MRVHPTFAAFLAVGVHFAYGSPLHPRDIKPLKDILSTDLAGKCFDNDWKSEESRKKIWLDSGAGSIIDEYMKKGLYPNWSQDMWMSIFPQASPSSFSCFQSEDLCTVAGLDCPNFESAGWAGAFYVMASLDNFNKFLNQLRSDLNALKADLALSVPATIQALGVDKYMKLPDDKINPFQMLAACFGAASGIGAASPLVGGGLGFVSAMNGMTNALIKKKDTTKSVNELEADILLFAKEAVDDYINWVNNVRGTVYGFMGQDGFDQPIPEVLKNDPDNKYVDAVTKVFGNGQWLLPNPTESVFHGFKGVQTLFDRSIAWQILRRVYKATLIISTSEKNEGDCNKWPNGAWHAKHNECWILTAVKNKQMDREFKEATFLWDKWGVNKWEMFNNAVECWLAEPVGEWKAPDIQEDPLLGGLPRCIYATEVKKGHWMDADPQDGDWVLLDKDWPQWSEKAKQETDGQWNELRYDHDWPFTNF